MANTNSVDTWQDLERRFHEIGNLPTTTVLLEFTEGKPSEPIQWTLSGVKKGECHITLIGGDRAAANQSRKYMGMEPPDGGEISNLMRRAGNLLVPHNPENIWEGADLFVAITVKKHRHYICTDGERKFFPNAGRIFAIMAGEMVLEYAKRNTQKRTGDNPEAAVIPLWSQEDETEGRRILKADAQMSSNDFAKKIGGNRQIKQGLYRHIKGKKKRSTRRN